MSLGLLFFSKATEILKMVASAATNCEKKRILLLFCLSYLYNINMRINSAHTSQPVLKDLLFINLIGLCSFQTCDIKSYNIIMKTELRLRLCNSEQLQCLQCFDKYIARQYDCL